LNIKAAFDIWLSDNFTMRALPSRRFVGTYHLRASRPVNSRQDCLI